MNEPSDHVDRCSIRLIGLLLLAAAGVASPACAGEHRGTAKKEAIYLDIGERDADWHAGWSDAVVAGDLVFVSGVVVSLRDDPSDTDLDAAFERAFVQAGKVLATAGTGWNDVVEMTIYATDVDAQLPALTKARLRHMQPPYAASTVVQVARLIPERGVAEIRVIARRAMRSR